LVNFTSVSKTKILHLLVKLKKIVINQISDGRFYFKIPHTSLGITVSYDANGIIYIVKNLSECIWNYI